jgi:hypothetical protein
MRCEIRVSKRSTDTHKGRANVRQVREKDGIITIRVNERRQGPNSLPRCHVVENDEHSASEICQGTSLHKMVDFKLISLKMAKKVTLSQYRPGQDLRAPGG